VDDTKKKSSGGMPMDLGCNFCGKEKQMEKPLMLMILDGWGINPSPEKQRRGPCRHPQP